MSTIASVNAASATASNWLKEAQESLVAAASPGGLLGTLQDARDSSGSTSRSSPRVKTRLPVSR